MHTCPRVKYSYSCQILIKFEFSCQISNLMKIRPVVAELSHEDGRTDMKLIAGFRNFARAPYNRSRHQLAVSTIIGRAVEGLISSAVTC